jgi:hypothetical protein
MKLLLYLSLILTISLNAKDTELKKIFNDFNVDGTIVIESLQKQVDKNPKENYDCVVRVSVDFIETKLQGFIEFLNKDKKRYQ